MESSNIVKEMYNKERKIGMKKDDSEENFQREIPTRYRLEMYNKERKIKIEKDDWKEGEILFDLWIVNNG